MYSSLLFANKEAKFYHSLANMHHTNWKPDPKFNQILTSNPNKQHFKRCIPISHFLNVFFLLQVLLFLQKEKEESPPEAQVKEENGENLKHCGHCQVLNGSNYTDALSLISF